MVANTAPQSGIPCGHDVYNVHPNPDNLGTEQPLQGMSGLKRQFRQMGEFFFGRKSDHDYQSYTHANSVCNNRNWFTGRGKSG